MDAAARNTEHASFNRLPEHGGIETLAAHYIEKKFKPHYHAEYLIGVITGGVHQVWCRGEQHAVSAGTVMTMRPGDVHHGNAAIEDGWVQRMFYVSEAAMADILGDQTHGASRGLPHFGVVGHFDARLAGRLAQIHDVVHASRLSLSRDAALTKLADVVGALSTGSTDQATKIRHDDRRAAKLVDYLHAHVEADIRLETLAALVGLGRRQTIDLFKNRTGMPPHAYHIGLKVRKVQGLLRNGSSLAAAAAEAGFADQSHMSRHFAAIVGTTPAAYASA
ncbi:MAG: hypothetical protein K0R85_219 [Devosia sp.]|nr:hypothetical protein [Devosia sp.]